MFQFRKQDLLVVRTYPVSKNLVNAHVPSQTKKIFAKKILPFAQSPVRFSDLCIYQELYTLQLTRVRCKLRMQRSVHSNEEFTLPMK